MDITELYSLFREHPIVSTDTRECPPSSIFFALRGETFNGNQFAQQALETGCTAAVVDDANIAATDSRMILVPDTLQTLQKLAAYHRHQLATPIVQITGTNGKTTTKELTAAVLAECYRVHFTQGNLNNHIGVPKTLLQLCAKHEVAVIETGANHPGEIAQLSQIVDADCGLITNVGMAHLEGFGSFEGVVRTKGELYDHLRSKIGGYIFLNADDEHLRRIADGLPAVRYGRPGQDYDVEGEVVACEPLLHLRWRVRGGNWQDVQTQLIGSYNINNVLAAAAVGTRFGVAPEQISHAIAQYMPTNSRSELRKTARNTLVVDAYNANPTSMKAALDNFRLISHPHKMVILGSMRELGEATATAHVDVAAQLRTLNAEEVWLVGEEFRPCSDGYRHFPDVEAVKEALAAAPVSGRLILIKGSNSTKLHQLPPLL
ncbi:MAG: UDP-N-acetylmuramoyl-tripeptide--D-alanyl-D-alanine ligase [Alloprevotella sp.]|nr:UDP-N-acetylmuramoyl-tripeptide--D-alanyl-D-alanine ligase [Alloprevotella sp.]